MDIPDIDPRYSRQMLFPPIGKQGQHKLNHSRVAIVGMGALGTVLANHMVRAGVGFVRIIDRDFVEASNLQRQMLYDEQDALQSVPKASAAAIRLRHINSLVEIESHVADLNPLNAETLLSDVDLVLDGTDNFSVRFLINDVCIKLGIPWIYGGAVSSRGVTLTIVPQQTPCLRCVFGEAPPVGSGETCDTSGVIGPIVHIVASYQAVEAFKLLVGDQTSLSRKMIHIDLWNNHHAAIDVSQARKEDCPACAQKQFDYLDLTLSGETIQSLCGRNTVQILPLQTGLQTGNYNLNEWAAKWQPLGKIDLTPFLLKLQIDNHINLVLFSDGRAMIQGTDDLIYAKNLYSRFIGM